MKTHAIAILLLINGSLLAGPLVPENVSADAKWVLHLDVDRFRKTSIGQFYVTNMLDKHLEETRKKHKYDFSSLVRSLRSVTAYGEAYDKDSAKSWILVLTADEPAVEEVEKLLGSEGERKKKSLPPLKTDRKRGLIFVGHSEKHLQKAWDVVEGKEPSAARTGQIKGLNANGDDFVFVAAADALNQRVALPANAKLFRKTENVRLTLGERAANLLVKVTLKAEDAEVATQIRQVAEGVLAFMAMERSEDASIQALAKSAKITSEAEVVTASLEFPSARLIDMLKSHGKKSGKK